MQLFPEFKTWTISFEDTDTFNKILDIGLDILFESGVVDIGHSDMILIFDDIDKFEKFKNILTEKKIKFIDDIRII